MSNKKCEHTTYAGLIGAMDGEGPSKCYQDAVEHNPDEPLAYYNLISVYDKCKMFEQAEQARQRLKERFAKRSKPSAS